MKITKEFEKEIAPFFWVEHEHMFFWGEILIHKFHKWNHDGAGGANMKYFHAVHSNFDAVSGCQKARCITITLGHCDATSSRKQATPATMPRMDA